MNKKQVKEEETQENKGVNSYSIDMDSRGNVIVAPPKTSRIRTTGIGLVSILLGAGLFLFTFFLSLLGPVIGVGGFILGILLIIGGLMKISDSLDFEPDIKTLLIAVIILAVVFCLILFH